MGRAAFDKLSGGELLVIAGPCAVEGEQMLMETAERVVGICSELGLPLVFKSSYRKANRSRIDSFTGIGDEAALKLLAKASKEFGCLLYTSDRCRRRS